MQEKETKIGDENDHRNIKTPYPITVNKNKELKNNVLRNKYTFAKILCKKNTETIFPKISLEKPTQDEITPDKIVHKAQKIAKQEKNKNNFSHIQLNKTQIKNYIMSKQKTLNKILSRKNSELNYDNKSLNIIERNNKIYIPKKLDINNPSIYSINKNVKEVALNNVNNNININLRKKKKTLCGISTLYKNLYNSNNESQLIENTNKTEASIIKKNEKKDINATEIDFKRSSFKKQNTFEYYKTLNNLKYSEKSNSNSKTNTINTKSTINSNKDIFIKKRNSNKSEENSINKTHTSRSINNVKKHSFQYLIHQAHNNLSISTSFNRCYEKKNDSGQISDEENEWNAIKKKQNSLTNRNYNSITPTNMSIFYKMQGFKSFRNKISKSQFKKRIDITPVILEKRKDSKIDNFIGVNSNDEKISISNKIINNNIYNTTLNVYKINDSSKRVIKNFSNEKIKQNITETNNLFINDIKQVLRIQEKIIKLLNNNIKCNNECNELIKLFFKQEIYYGFNNFIFEMNNQKKILDYLKFEIVSYFLSFDLTNNKNYNKCNFLLKSIYSLINKNWQKILEYFVEKSNFNPENENNLIEVIYNNFNSIVTYYKMIIDSAYKKYYEIDNNEINFPYCIYNFENIGFDNEENEKNISKIKKVFFYEAYNNINNIDYNDLIKFYKTFLLYNINNLNNIENTNKENKILPTILPKIKNSYKYSLILDLDETLVFFRKENVFINSNETQKIKNEEIITNYTKNTLILRPGLTDFLRKMKIYFELILFSSGSYDYVNPIINMIEKDEQFFEYILYRKHVEYDEKGDIIKNLDMLGRNLKNIIIVDDIYQYFRLHKDNGICIKPFKGDSLNDGDTLKYLGEILVKIVNDAEITGDIRISLCKFKNLLYPKVINNKLCI